MQTHRNKIYEYIYGTIKVIGVLFVCLLIGIDWDTVFPLLGL